LNTSEHSKRKGQLLWRMDHDRAILEVSGVLIKPSSPMRISPHWNISADGAIYDMLPGEFRLIYFASG
jgi:hypothetical protein